MPSVPAIHFSGKPFVVIRHHGGTIDKFALGSAGAIPIWGFQLARSIEGQVWLYKFSTSAWTLEGGQIY